MSTQAPSPSGAHHAEPTYEPIDELTGEIKQSKPTLLSLISATHPDKTLADVLKELETLLGVDPKAEGTASLKLWRPDVALGRDAAMLIAQKSTTLRMAAKYVLSVGAYLEQYYGFKPIELYVENGDRPASQQSGAGAPRQQAQSHSSGGPRQQSQSRGGGNGGGGNRYPKVGAGIWRVNEVKIIDTRNSNRLMTVKTVNGEAITKLEYLEKQGYNFEGWAVGEVYAPPPEMQFVVVEKEGYIARFSESDA